jgi:type VI secretion system secreted protein VgrG
MSTRFLFRALPLPLFTSIVVAGSACAPAPDPQPSAHTESALAAPALGSSSGFAVLGATTVTNTGATTIDGDVGVSPGLALVGFPPAIITGGTTHLGDAVALQAQSDVSIAFDALSAEACTQDLTGTDLGGLTLTPGVYCFSSSAQLTGSLVLDAAGRADAVFIFKTASTLTTASNASVRVINGGNDCSVFWQVGSSATLGTGTVFAGNILALASISMTTGAKVSGRAFARTGAITMDTNAVSRLLCSSAPAVDAGAPDAAQPDSAVPVPDAATAPDAATPAVDAGPSEDAATPDAAAPPDAAPDAACCEGTLSLCGTVCLDLTIDGNNCGACGTACAMGTACTMGVCVPSLPSLTDAGLPDCN